MLNQQRAIRKTKSILSGLRQKKKPVHYFALDVSRQGLTASLDELRNEFKDSPFITITGLLGTYDDAVSWLAELKNARSLGSVTIMWLGNSIANLDSHDQASAFLARFNKACQQSHLACRFVISTDNCQRDAKVLEAYDVERPEYRDFLLNALEAANRVLGYDAFSAADWTPGSWLDQRERNLQFFVTARRDVLVQLSPATNGSTNGKAAGAHGGTTHGTNAVTVRKGERVRLVTSGKWSEADMGQICARAGFRIRQSWKDASGDYSTFLMVTEKTIS